MPLLATLVALAAALNSVPLEPMPRTYREPIASSAVAAPRGRQAALDVAARPVDTTITAARDPLEELGRALQEVNPAFQALASRQAEEGRGDALKIAQEAAARNPNPKDSTGWDLPYDPRIPVAYRKDAEEAYRKGIGSRIGAGLAGDFSLAYAEASRSPDFRFDDFARDFRQKQIAGLATPELAIEAGRFLDNAISQAHTLHVHKMQQRAAEEARTTFTAALSPVGPDNENEQNAAWVRDAVDTFVRAGGTRPEAAELLLADVTAKSVRLGGRPGLFDLFDVTDPSTGMTLGGHSPKFAEAVARAKRQAEEQYDREWDKAHFVTKQTRVADFNAAMERGDFVSWTPEQFRAHILPEVGDGGAFEGKLPQLEAAFFKSQQEAALLAADRAHLVAGRAAILSEDRQRKLLGEVVSPLVAAVVSEQGDIPAALSRLTAVYSDSGASVADPTMKAWVKSVFQHIPKDPTAVPDKFKWVAQFYAGLKKSANPALRKQYFAEEEMAAIESYLADTNEAAVDSPTAFAAALRHVDPAERARVDAMMKDTAFRDNLSSSARTAVVSLWRRGLDWLPFVETAPDTTLLGIAAQREGQRFALATGATPEQVQAHVKRWAADNSYHDTFTNTVVEVPMDRNTPVAQEALTNWMRQLSEAHGKAVPQLIHNGEGRYTITMWAGDTRRTIGSVSLDDILRADNAQRNLTGAELPTLGGLRRRVLDGTATPGEIAENLPLIEKATRLGAWDGALAAKTNELRSRALTEHFTTQVGNSLKATATQSKPARRVAQHVNAITAGAAKQFLDSGNHTAALVAASEGFAAKAYKDGSGITVGFGYNIVANEKHAAEDFRRAGIPPELVEAVKAGKAQITLPQAQRLLTAVLPRYEAIAETAVNRREAGAWAKLPANQRAVLTDLAYQRPATLRENPAALDAFLDGDFSGDALVIPIAGSKKHPGAQRRHDLRVATLASTTNLSTILSYAARQPANAVAARVAAAGGP
jgi:GH24 family phage-related lysozyme (muramidase)